jgi:hypothetical protein
MNEDNLFDDIARTLASPLPRRKAFGHIIRGLAGAALASTFWPEVARAGPIPRRDGRCPPNHFNCNGVVCCLKNQTCCGNVCCLPPRQCCVHVCCRPNELCENGKCVRHVSESTFQSDGS